MADMKKCLCGATPIMHEDYDTLQIICPRCGRKGARYFGDYYDEAFMEVAYGRDAITNWNQKIEDYMKNLWFWGVGGGDAE